MRVAEGSNPFMLTKHNSWPRVSVAPLLAKFKEEGITGSELARRLGWYRGDKRWHEADGSRVMATLRRSTVSEATAKQIAEALRMDSRDAGL